RSWIGVLLLSCTGNIGSVQVPGSETPAAPAPSAMAAEVVAPGKSGIRRLTRTEYARTVGDLLGVDVSSALTTLPEDVRDPFDNDYLTQSTSAVLVESIESLAGRIADRVLANESARRAIVGCTPNSPADAECMKTFLSRFGRRVLRRALVDEEIERF